MKIWISRFDDHLRDHATKAPYASGGSTRSALYIFNTLRLFTNKPIREQEIKLECRNWPLWTWHNQKFCSWQINAKLSCGDQRCCSKVRSNGAVKWETLCLLGDCQLKSCGASYFGTPPLNAPLSFALTQNRICIFCNICLELPFSLTLYIDSLCLLLNSLHFCNKFTNISVHISDPS